MMMRKCLVATAAGMLLLTHTAVPSRAHAGTTTKLNILLIGSSLVRGVKTGAKHLYRSIGVKARIKGSARARWTLADHASSSRTAKIINQRPWDVVLLANASIGIGAAYYDDATLLYDKIVPTGAAVGFMMTWFAEGTPLGAYDDLVGIAGGDIGYVPIALQLDVPIAPAGWGVRNVVEDNAQSGIPLDLWQNSQHLNRAGRYLAAAIVFTTLTHMSPEGSWAPGGLTPNEIDYLQILARDTVLSDPGRWNITVE